jgi:hypothetical protein
MTYPRIPRPVSPCPEYVGRVRGPTTIHVAVLALHCLEKSNHTGPSLSLPSPLSSTRQSLDDDPLYLDTLQRLTWFWESKSSLGRTVIGGIPEYIFIQLRNQFDDKLSHFSYEPDKQQIIVRELPTAMHECTKAFLAELQGTLQSWVEGAVSGAEVEVNGSLTHDLYSRSGASERRVRKKERSLTNLSRSPSTMAPLSILPLLSRPVTQNHMTTFLTMHRGGSCKVTTKSSP